MAHHSTHYQVLSDLSTITLSSTKTSDTREFTTTHDADLTASELRPLLCFQIDPSSNANLRLDVFIKDHSNVEAKIAGYSLLGGAPRWTMEPINPALVTVDATNTIVFRASEITAGSVAIQNIVVFFQRYIS